MNTFGNILRLTTFGESHGAAIGGVLDGFPAGITIDFSAIAADLARRAGRDTVGASARAAHEDDAIEWLSGIYEGQTLGTPIAFLLRNTDARSSDYDALSAVYRPGHADYTYQAKYGIRDTRGGGRSSARETAVRVVAGALAKQWLQQQGVSVSAEVTQVGESRTPSEWQDMLRAVQSSGDSIGGIITCTIHGLPAGVGEPLYDKLSARLAYAMLSINGCKGFDFGSGFDGVGERGSVLNDAMTNQGFATNHAGGILGGISTGQDVVFRCVFKPTPSISLPQQTVTSQGEECEVRVTGRHDVCIAMRAPVIVEAMAALVAMDLHLCM